MITRNTRTNRQETRRQVLDDRRSQQHFCDSLKTLLFMMSPRKLGNHSHTNSVTGQHKNVNPQKEDFENLKFRLRFV